MNMVSNIILGHRERAERVSMKKFEVNVFNGVEEIKIRVQEVGHGLAVIDEIYSDGEIFEIKINRNRVIPLREAIEYAEMLSY